jgi:hypothetical protein
MVDSVTVPFWYPVVLRIIKQMDCLVCRLRRRVLVLFWKIRRVLLPSPIHVDRQ